MPDVLVVEDAEGPRVDLVDYLTLKGFGAAGVASGEEARQALSARLPAVIVLDIGLPDCNGFDLAREIRARYGLACGIIILTGFASVDDKVEGLASGADIYLVKHTSLREIEANIRGLLRRLSSAETAGAAPPPAPAAGRWRVEPESWRLVSPSEETVQLTATEFACVAALFRCRGTPVPRSDLIAALDRPSMRYNDRNLDALISRLRRKVAGACGTDLPISVVYGVGYVFRDGPPG